MNANLPRSAPCLRSGLKLGPDRAHFDRLHGLGLLQEVILRLALLGHVVVHDPGRDPRRTRTPVAMLLRTHHDSGFRRGTMPTNQAFGVWAPPFGVRIAAAHHLGGAGLAGKVDAFQMRRSLP